MKKYIIDVSHHNGRIDWESASAYLEHVIIRMGYRGYKTGELVRDSRSKYNIDGCFRNKIPFSFYYFPTEINIDETIQAAEWIYNQLNDFKLDPVNFYLDSEYTNGGRTGRSDKLSRGARTEYLIHLAENLHDFCPIWRIGVYGSNSWFKDKLEYKRLQEHNLLMWVARWGNNKPDPELKTNLWQYSSTCHIDGIKGNVDINKILS